MPIASGCALIRSGIASDRYGQAGGRTSWAIGQSGEDLSMKRFSIVLGVVIVAILLSLGGYVVAQEEPTSPDGGATPTEVLCATPLAEATGTPEMVVPAPTTAGTPGGSEPGTPIGLFPCATPFDSTPTGG
jgi:hypothetical protein